MNSQQLRDNIACTNNGYLFAPTHVELACARLHPDQFTVSVAGAIAPKGFVIPTYPDPQAKPAVSHASDWFDWEGAILARQYTGD
jgi:hypothetical protein